MPKHRSPPPATLRQRFALDTATETAVLEDIARHPPRLSERQLEAAGQRRFSLHALREGDLRGFVALRKLALDREKFEFDAAEVCLAKLPELKTISKDPRLTTVQKIDEIRLKLFGELAGGAPPDADREEA